MKNRWGVVFGCMNFTTLLFEEILSVFSIKTKWTTIYILVYMYIYLETIEVGLNLWLNLKLILIKFLLMAIFYILLIVALFYC